MDIAGDLGRRRLTLPATRIGPLHMNISRAKLALRDRDGALDSLADAWEAAPQMATVHPTSQELLRVLVSLHKRSNPKVIKLVKQAQMKEAYSRQLQKWSAITAEIVAEKVLIGRR